MFQPDVAGTYTVRLTVHDGCTQATTELTVVAACSAAPAVALTTGPLLRVAIDGVTGLARDVVPTAPGTLWAGASNASLWMPRRRATALNASASRGAVTTVRELLLP